MAENDIAVHQENSEGTYDEIVLQESATNVANVPTSDEKAALAGTGTPSSSNKFVTENDIPSTLNKATHAEIDAGTDDIKYVTAKGIKDAKNVPSVAPGTSGNVLTSDGADWTSAAPPGGGLDINALTDKTTPADDDITVIEDSAATWTKKKLLWSNIKATLKTYFDTLYEAAIGTKGTAFNKNFGSAVDTVAQGNDSRFPTTDEKAALAGTGTPSSSNKYVTENDIPASGGLTVGRALTDTANIETGDENTWLTFNNAAAKTLTVTKNFMSAGDTIAIEQIGAGVLTLAAGTGVTLNGAKKSWGQYSVVKLFCRDATTDANVITVIGGSA